MKPLSNPDSLKADLSICIPRFDRPVGPQRIEPEQTGRMVETPTTYDRIYELASKLLHEHGAYFVFQHLVDEAGVGSGGLRKLFPGQAHVVAVFAEHEFENIEKSWAALCRSPEEGPSLERLAYELVEWLVDTYGRAEQMLKAVRHPDKELHALTRRIIDLVAPLVERGVSSGWLLDGVTTEEFVVSVFSAAATADALVGGPPSATSERRILEANLYLENMLEGIKTRVRGSIPTTEG